ncbi:MAG: hypothetical protein R3292_02570 [Alcanivorax sp.]|nr:hypothetical protein [Alcanivorax sp.]
MVSSTKGNVAGQLRMLWFLILSVPLLAGVGLTLVIHQGLLQATGQLLPRPTLWTVAMVAMVITLLVARPLSNWLFSPERLAAMTVQGHTNLPEDPQQLAELKTRASMFMALGMLDAVSMILIGVSVFQADAQLALLNGVYALVLAAVAKPDFSTLIRETLGLLRQQS